MPNLSQLASERKRKGKIVKVEGKDAIHGRLPDMEVMRGTEFEVEKKAPLGDPIDITMMGYHLSPRKYEVQMDGILGPLCNCLGLDNFLSRLSGRHGPLGWVKR